MAMFDRNMSYLAASPRWVSDYRLEESPLGHNHYEVFPEFGDALRDVHRRCLAGAVEAHEADRFERADGRVQWVSWECRPWQEAGGGIGGLIIATTDVTSRIEAQRRAEESARRAEAAERRLKDAIDALPAGFDLYDAEDRLVVSNAAAEAMYPHTVEARRSGISFESLLSVGVGQRIHGPEATDNERWLKERMARHRRPAGPFDQLTAEGRWLRIEERPISDGGVVVIRSDVTDIKARELALAERTALLEAVLKHMGEGVTVYGPDHRLLIQNSLATELFKLPPELGRPGTPYEAIMRFTAERGDYGAVDIDAHVRESDARLDTRSPWGAETRTPDGRVAEARFNPMPEGGGIFVIRDVTERRAAEDRLRASEQRFRMLVEEAPDAIVLFDFDEGRFVDANAAAERLFGTSRNELLERGPRRYYAPEQPDARPIAQSYDEHDRCALAGEEVGFERRIRRPGGEERMCRVSLVRLPSKTRLVRGSYVDVTDQRMAEARLSETLRSIDARQEAERQRISRELHDTLGQYLAAMNIQLAAVGRNADDPEATRSVASDLRRLTEAVGDEVHRLAWELRPTALDDLGLGPALEHYVDGWGRRFGLACSVHVALRDRRLPAKIETAFYRVLQEALTNVVKHAGAKSVGVALEASTDAVIMFIEDDGVGFDGDDVRRVTPRLGLRGIEERLAAIHGSLEVDSGAGRGTTLIVRAPLERADVARPARVARDEDKRRRVSMETSS